jgi:hypothetical protein
MSLIEWIILVFLAGGAVITGIGAIFAIWIWMTTDWQDLAQPPYPANREDIPGELTQTEQDQGEYRDTPSPTEKGRA